MNKRDRQHKHCGPNSGRLDHCGGAGKHFNSAIHYLEKKMTI